MYRIAIGAVVALTVGAVIWYQHDAIVKLRADLQTCNTALAPMRAAAARVPVLEAENAAARAAASTTAKAHATRADKELATPASVPGDSCASATDRANRWLQERKK